DRTQGQAPESWLDQTKKYPQPCDSGFLDQTALLVPEGCVFLHLEFLPAATAPVAGSWRSRPPSHPCGRHGHASARPHQFEKSRETTSTAKPRLRRCPVANAPRTADRRHQQAGFCRREVLEKGSHPARRQWLLSPMRGNESADAAEKSRST